MKCVRTFVLRSGPRKSFYPRSRSPPSFIYFPRSLFLYSSVTWVISPSSQFSAALPENLWWSIECYEGNLITLQIKLTIIDNASSYFHWMIAIQWLRFNETDKIYLSAQRILTLMHWRPVRSNRYSFISLDSFPHVLFVCHFEAFTLKFESISFCQRGVQSPEKHCDFFYYSSGNVLCKCASKFQ